MSQCKGKVIAIGETKTGESQRGKWASQQRVVEEQGQQYPEHWVLETFGEENINKYDLHVGDVVDVKYNARYTEKNDIYYSSNRPWEVEKEQQQA